MNLSAKMRQALLRIAEGNTLCGHSELTLRALMVRGLIEFEPATEQTSYKPVLNVTPVKLTGPGKAKVEL